VEIVNIDEPIWRRFLAQRNSLSLRPKGDESQANDFTVIRS